MQNSSYADALERGRAAAEKSPAVLDAVMAIVRPVVECNRKQIDNGRTYLREMIFGDPEEPHHRQALALSAETEEAVVAILRRDESVTEPEASAQARIISAIMFVSMAASINIGRTVDDLLQDIRTQAAVLLGQK